MGISQTSGQQERHLPGRDQIPLIGCANVGPMRGKPVWLLLNGLSSVLALRNPSTVYSGLDAEKRFHAPNQEGVAALQSGHI